MADWSNQRFFARVFFSSMKLYYLRWYTQAPQGITFYCTGCSIKVPTKREYYILDRTANNFVNMIFNVWIRWAFLLMGENLWNVKYIQSLTIAIVFELIYYTNGHPKGQLISKANCQAEDSSKKRTNEFVFTSMRRVFVRFLEESSARKKRFEIIWPLASR